MSEADLERCAEDMKQEVLNQAAVDGEETLVRDAFTRIAVDILAGAGEVDDGQVAFHQAHGVEVAGYNLGEEGVLDLFVTLYSGQVPPQRATAGSIDTAFKRLKAFLRKALAGYHTGLEEASSGFDVAQQIYQLRGDLRQVRLYCLTDSVAPTYERSTEDEGGVELSFGVWDIERLCRATSSGRGQEAIEIDIEEMFGGPIPCLATPSLDGVYRAYLAVVPAILLADLYDRYRDRLLELNVRSFLQAKGKVNQGIRRTINEEPEKFLAYNNGITATAERLTLCGLPNGGLGIRAICNLQIVNGGQTTASLHYAAKRDRADLSHIAVQAKIIVVPAEVVLQLVPLVARYSNTQNKVQEADFAANDSFHVGLEELSRVTWAPSADGTNLQTRWFYERARGQYQQAVIASGTPAKQKAFKTSNPLKQKFSKTDLAKFENTWEQLPHIVSLGAQKNFREFTIQLAKDGPTAPDEEYFRRLVAKAILFKRAERIVGEMTFGGYRANIVTYAIASLCHLTARRLDLDRIWRDQGITGVTADAIAEIASTVYKIITKPPKGGNVTEWCKKAACWQEVLEAEMKLSLPLAAELIDVRATGRSPRGGADAAQASEGATAVEEAHQVPAETWLMVSKWAKETDSLAAWQRGLAYSLGRIAKDGRHPSVKQAVQGLVLLKKARDLGFREVDPSG